MIRFAESFRLHAAMAEFLRQEVYRHDGIAYHSQEDGTCWRPTRSRTTWSRGRAATRSTRWSWSSTTRRRARCATPSSRRSSSRSSGRWPTRARYGLDAVDGLGIVVPHRAQRAALQQAFPELSIIDPATGLPARSAIDTVERFQGGERTVILVERHRERPGATCWRPASSCSTLAG